MSVCVSFLTPREACYAIERVCRSEFDTLVARPWNMYEPDITTWWLVPSSDWPAYKHGKCHFNWGNENRDSIFMSLYFEKGLGSIVSSVYSCPKGLRCIMDNDWSWYRLIRDLENGRIPQKVAQISKEIPIPVELVVEGGYVQDPCDFDPNAPGFKGDTCGFVWDNNLGFTQRWSHVEAGLLTPLGELRTFNELPQILRVFNTNDWLWVNFHIGMRLEIQNKAPSNQERAVWSASDIWQNFFRPLSLWLV